MDLIEHGDESETAAWEAIRNLVPELDDPLPAQFEKNWIFAPSLNRRLATCFLQRQRQERETLFLTSEQLEWIASEKPERKRLTRRSEIDDIAGIYVFATLCNSKILKVGESGALRTRIADKHLRGANETQADRLIVHCKDRWEWPSCLIDREIVGILLPMRGSCKPDRCFIESGLHELLRPEMP